MSEPTLSEFLLARIAEDEAAELRGLDHSAGNVARIQGKALDEVRGPLALQPHHVRRMADIEAKRAIVAWHDETEDCCEERYGPLVLDAEPTLSAGTDSRAV